MKTKYANGVYTNGLFIDDQAGYVDPKEIWAEITNSYLKHKVTGVSTVAQFLDTFYKPELLKDIRETLISLYTKELKENGFCFIPDFRSKTGKTVAFFG